MALHRITRGLDLPISGAPEQQVHDGPPIARVAVMGDDTPGLRARFAVAEGDTVRRGQLLFEDRARPGVRYTAPGAGRVVAIFRGARRMLRSVVIQLSDAEQAGASAGDEAATFSSRPGSDPIGWSSEQIRTLLLESGLWVAIRERPYGKVAAPEGRPAALLVTAIDTNPHAPLPELAVSEARAEFELGLRLLAKLTDGPTYLCVRPESEIAKGLDAPVEVQEFRGPHPAGCPGVHIHLLAPVSRRRSAWHVGYADVIAVGRLAATGVLDVGRIVALGGPRMLRPRLVRSRLGASLDELTRREIRDDGEDVRRLSGSVLSGKVAHGPEFGFLGRYHLQVSALTEGRERRLFGWAMPGGNQFSVLPVFLSRLRGRKEFDFTTDTNGSYRPIMPIGTYERVMPMDILATYLLRALVVGDIEQAEKLGALELEEEDLALCSFVCPGKTDFGPYLRANLERIEKEG